MTAANGLQPDVDGPDVVICHRPFDPSTFDGAVCSAHVELVRDAAAAHGASVRVELDPDGPPCRFHIEQGPRR